MVEKIPLSTTPVSSVKNQPVKQQTNQSQGEGRAFQEILQQQMGVKFSAHAQQRLDAGKISLGPKELKMIDEAVAKVEAKGGRESLVLFNNVAFIVSIKNKTVITAVDADRLKENVFTNIDSAIIV